MSGGSPAPKKAKTSSSKSYSLQINAPEASTIDERPFIVDDPTLAEARLDYDLMRRTGNRKTHQRMLKSETSKTNIRVCNFGDKGTSTDYNYVVCVVDQEKGEANVYDAEIFSTHRTVKVLEAAEASAAAALSSAEPSRAGTPVDYKAAKALLGETFGTKKVKQALHSLEKNQINIGQLESSSAGFINRNLDKSIDRIQEAASKEVSETSSVAGDSTASLDVTGLLPPFDAKTGNVEEIFKISDLIATEAFYALPIDEFSGDSSESWEDIQKRFGMVDYVLDRIRNSMDVDDGGHRLRCLLYLHYLIKLRETKEGALNTEASLEKALPGASPVLQAHLLGLFTESMTVATGQIRRKLSALCKDRLVTHICILTLLLESPSYRVNLTILATVLKMPVTRMVDHFKAVGCAVEKPGKDEDQMYTVPGQSRSLQIKHAMLKAPITFPKPKRGPMK